MMFLFLVGSALADDTFVQFQADTAVTVADLSVDERLKVLIDKPLGKKVGISVFTLVSADYGEIILGPTLHVSNFSFNASVGLETADMPLRAQVFLYWAKEHFEVLASVETGGSGPWYVGFAKGTFGHLTAGVLTQRFDGVGPRLGVTTHGLELWTSPMYDYEDGAFNIVSGLSWIP